MVLVIKEFKTKSSTSCDIHGFLTPSVDVAFADGETWTFCKACYKEHKKKHGKNINRKKICKNSTGNPYGHYGIVCGF